MRNPVLILYLRLGVSKLWLRASGHENVSFLFTTPDKGASWDEVHTQTQPLTLRGARLCRWAQSAWRPVPAEAGSAVKGQRKDRGVPITANTGTLRISGVRARRPRTRPVASFDL